LTLTARSFSGSRRARGDPNIAERSRRNAGLGWAASPLIHCALIEDEHSDDRQQCPVSLGERDGTVSPLRSVLRSAAGLRPVHGLHVAGAPLGSALRDAQRNARRFVDLAGVGRGLELRSGELAIDGDLR
jgi:hypothetical protein